jgi:hypothetical protein
MSNIVLDPNADLGLNNGSVVPSESTVSASQVPTQMEAPQPTIPQVQTSSVVPQPAVNLMPQQIPEPLPPVIPELQPTSSATTETSESISNSGVDFSGIQSIASTLKANSSVTSPIPVPEMQVTGQMPSSSVNAAKGDVSTKKYNTLMIISLVLFLIALASAAYFVYMYLK